jgi:superfamily II DNA or RNA helicase
VTATDPPALKRFSSRGGRRLDHVYLADRLRGALSYRRIAGYFRSSVFELVGEQIADIPSVQIVCNSELDPADFRVAKASVDRGDRPAALLERWNDSAVELEALLERDRYRQLYELLTRGNVEIRVVPKDQVFLHGKAGVIERVEGKTAFLGSINETRSAYAANYEILWEDPSPEGVAWVEDEFAALWQNAIPLPDAVVTELKRRADRSEIKITGTSPKDVPGATFVESPLYRGGEQLQPWQRAFVALFLQHRERYGKVRLVLADEVGLGKTLSMAASAVVGALLENDDGKSDGPVLILCPSTLQYQWQTELDDRLGVPSAVWSSTDKVWLDPKGNIISPKGSDQISRCPYQVAIVSTGLVVRQTSDERRRLLKGRYGTVILDEAHKARARRGLGVEGGAPNNLLAFMRELAKRTRHLLLGTATPIQTDAGELWDLLGILDVDADFVLGARRHSLWSNLESVLAYVKGQARPEDDKTSWELLRNPLPPEGEDAVFGLVRSAQEMRDDEFVCRVGLGDLAMPTRSILEDLPDSFFQHHNPVVRHTVLRKRSVLEDRGLLDRIAVDVHPDPKAPPGTYDQVNFLGQALLTNPPFQAAYAAAERFATLLGTRTAAAGLIKASLLQRICSSFASGLSTATRLLQRGAFDDVAADDYHEDVAEDDADAILQNLTSPEIEQLRTIVDELSQPEARDPKLATVLYFLDRHFVGVGTDRRTWLGHGCIIFSQYYDTARWVADALARAFPSEPVAIYAGAGRSAMHRDGRFVTTEREAIKQAVKERRLRLLVATDAACEGLNLQTLGTLINVDLPWNPSRLEQRLGRIKRFGQARSTVDMLNLVYAGTRDERVYRALSSRMRDTYDLFGSLPDTIDDTWIEDETQLGLRLDQYVSERDAARNAFDVRYNATIAPAENRWERCSQVFARRDVIDRLSKPW